MHTRIVYSILDFMGDVGGFAEAIMILIFFIFSGAAYYSAKVEMMLNFYSDKALYNSKYQNGGDHEGGYAEDE